MNLPKAPIQCYEPLIVGSFVSISSVQDFYGLKYTVAQCGHIESIDTQQQIAVIDWHHGVAPKQTVKLFEIHFIKPNHP